MPTIDLQHRELELRICVFGGSNELLIDSLGLEGEMLKLGQLQGWRPFLKFRSFSRDPWAGDGADGAEVEAYAPFVDGLILTDSLEEGRHYSSIALERLQRALSPAKLTVPTAIFGYDALATEWASLSGVSPVCVFEPLPENAMPAVKAVAAALLRSRMRSMPPPPPPSSRSEPP